MLKPGKFQKRGVLIPSCQVEFSLSFFFFFSFFSFFFLFILGW